MGKSYDKKALSYELAAKMNETILSRYLGCSADRIAALTQSGVLVQEPLVRELRERGEIT